MKTDAILLVIGAVFMLTGFAGSIRYNGGSVLIKNPWIRIATFVFGLVFITAGLIPYYKHSTGGKTGPRKCENCITHPLHNDVVNNSTIIKGVFNDIEKDLWVMIWPENSGNKVWPQFDVGSDGISIYKSKGNWSVSGIFGGPPQKYDILLYTASPEASRKINTIIDAWIVSDDYQGIHVTNLPTGLTELDRITVVKKE